MPKAVLNGAEFYYQVHGDKDAFPIILTHGLGCDHTIWHGQARAFKKNYKTVLWDARGHGRTEVTEEGYSIDQFTADLLALMRHLGISRAHLGGLSMGGWISYEFALAYPESVASLILSNCAGVCLGLNDIQIREARRLFEISAILAERSGLMNLADSSIAMMFTPQFMLDQPDLVSRARAQMASTSGLGYARTIRGVMLDFWDRTGCGLEDRLNAISAPTLILAGDLDMLTPLPTQEALHKSIPGSKFKVFPGCGHMSPVERTEDWNRAALEFLSEAGAE